MHIILSLVVLGALIAIALLVFQVAITIIMAAFAGIVGGSALLIQKLRRK